MSNSKAKMLDTIRKALSGVPDTEKPDDVEVVRTYRQKGNLKQNEIVDLFAERVGSQKSNCRKLPKRES